MPLARAADPTQCPLCGQPNRCAMELQKETGVEQGPCWCTTAVFAADLLERIDPVVQGKACVCAKCSARIDDPS